MNKRLKIIFIGGGVIINLMIIGLIIVTNQKTNSLNEIELESTKDTIKAHIELAYNHLYNLSEDSYHDNIKAALTLWSFDGIDIVENYEEDGLINFLKDTSARTEVVIKDVKVKGKKISKSITYPIVRGDESEVTYVAETINDVKTYVATVESYHKVTKGNKILQSEEWSEDLEIYTGFKIDSVRNPYGMIINVERRRIKINAD